MEFLDQGFERADAAGAIAQARRVEFTQARQALEGVGNPASQEPGLTLERDLAQLGWNFSRSVEAAAIAEYADADLASGGSVWG